MLDEFSLMQYLLSLLALLALSIALSFLRAGARRDGQHERRDGASTFVDRK